LTIDLSGKSVYPSFIDIYSDFGIEKPKRQGGSRRTAQYESKRNGYYWNEHIHDLEVATQPLGSIGFFDELDEYRFDKLRYLPQLVDFSGFSGKKLLEVGCGVGIDLVRFAKGGTDVTGIDLAEVSIDLAKQNFAHNDQ